jgi:phytoene desaturase
MPSNEKWHSRSTGTPAGVVSGDTTPNTPVHAWVNIVKHVIIIGAGLGGLSAAVRLADRGHRVTVLEKNARVGGKMDIWQEGGFTFDTGPSLLTMPFILKDLFTDLDLCCEDYLELVPLAPVCRYFFPDGETLDTSSDTGKMEDEIAKISPSDAGAFQRFLDHGREIYEASSEPFLFSPFAGGTPGALMRNLKYLPLVRKLDAFRTLNASVTEYFHDPHLRQIFNRFATYNGSSPYRAPATLAIIPYVEFSMGGWYIRGGMYKLAETLEHLALSRGVTARFGCEVSGLVHERRRVTGVRTKQGETLRADGVVCNADALYAHQQFLGGNGKGFFKRKAMADTSLAGFVLMLGLRKPYPGLAHHNIFFSSDYEAEFDDLVNKGVPADDPTVYVSLSCKSDSSHAPVGHSNMFILVNAPPVGPCYDWARKSKGYREVVLTKLKSFGLQDIESHIEVERVITPLDFQSLYNAFRGSIYGTSSNSRMSAFLRPSNKSRDLGNLYFVGGSAHPGGGIPLVLLSGKIVADMVHEDLG